MGFLGNKRILFIVILGLVFLGGLWSYLQFPKESIIREGIKEPTEVTAKQEVVKKHSRGETIGDDEGKVVFSESVICGGDTYIFETVLVENQTYYNEVHKTARSPENFIARLKSPRGDDLGFFSVLATPQKNCDRIYLTTGIQESDVPRARIYEWMVGATEAHELMAGQYFYSSFVPFHGTTWVSPDGEKIIVAQQTDPKEKNLWCDHRTLRLIHLREDRSEILLQLPEAETLDNGYSDLAPYCAGLNFGWLDDTTLYYDVYDATKGMFNVATESNRSLLERRTLKIN